MVGSRRPNKWVVEPVSTARFEKPALVVSERRDPVQDESHRAFRGNGTSFAVLSVATQQLWKGVNDEWQSKTEWHRVVVQSPRRIDRATAPQGRPRPWGRHARQVEVTTCFDFRVAVSDLTHEHRDWSRRPLALFVQQWTWPRLSPCQRFPPAPGNRSGGHLGGSEDGV